VSLCACASACLLAGWGGRLLPIEEQIRHDVPTFLSADGALQVENLTGKEPEHEANSVLGTVVAWNGNVDMPQQRVSVGKSNRRDVDIRRLCQGLALRMMVSEGRQKEGKR